MYLISHKEMFLLISSYPDIKKDDCHTVVAGFLFLGWLLSNLLQQYLSSCTWKPLHSMALNIKWQPHNPNSESWNSGLDKKNSPNEKKTPSFSTKSEYCHLHKKQLKPLLQEEQETIWTVEGFLPPLKNQSQFLHKDQNYWAL